MRSYCRNLNSIQVPIIFPNFRAIKVERSNGDGNGGLLALVCKDVTHIIIVINRYSACAIHDVLTLIVICFAKVTPSRRLLRRNSREIFAQCYEADTVEYTSRNINRVVYKTIKVEAKNIQ